jgi:hypothetical protein
MFYDKCVNCAEYKRCKDSFASWIFFIIGLVATLSIRVVTVLIHLDPIYGKIAWYIGVGGFFAFFLYKYRVNRQRSDLIDGAGLVEKISGGKDLTQEDYNIIGAILCALSSKQERINYFFIFALSAFALALAFYLDFVAVRF